jgi:hypothetical protein
VNAVVKLKSQQWRDVIDVHPAAKLFPLLSAEDLRKLGEDIKRHGLRSPIVLWAPGDQIEHGDYVLLDGQNRLDAMELMDLKTCENGKLTFTLADHSHVTGNRAEVVLHLHEFMVDIKGQRQVAVDPYYYAISANLSRRHLTKEQQAELIISAEKMRAENDLLKLGRSFSPTPGKAGGSTPDHVKQSAIATGEQQGISKSTMQRAWDKFKSRSRPEQKNLTKASPKKARVHHIRKEMRRLKITIRDLQGDIE